MRIINKILIKVSFVISVLLFLSGCETTNAIPYKASSSNIATMQTALADKGNLSVGNVNIAKDISLMCRLNGDIIVYPGKSIPEYVKDAFLEELIVAQKYDATSRKVSVNLENVSFSSITPANWEISAKVSSDNGVSYPISVKHEFDTSWSAAGACENVANAFGPTTQELIKEIVSNPKFALLSN
ncbi:hypothetical protein AYY19_00230 [Photobacterium aquimaris]|uniref:hypothetical protein n=1 Tax=Photobacterium aquimaris TaxID=512643 RepID=UPI0007EFF40A|nr:hypothetical protein [Photobacterium aquimaris]OBU15046.1 hypothetical protein AYY20_20525 [Photobacterium aquimaris]OBU18350.1 hypothetical protein AYY19_00230 [Photobacterium aquimaris]